jgi:Polyphosphate kinase 2 (PPK2)
MDLESRRRWELYTKAKEDMIERTHIPEARWWVVEGVDKKRARLNCIHHLLQQVLIRKFLTTRSCCLSGITSRTIRATLFPRICTFRQSTSASTASSWHGQTQ